LSVRVTSSESRIYARSLTSEAEALASGDGHAFVERCGDAFVAAVRPRHDFYAVLSIHTLHAREHEGIADEVDHIAGAALAVLDPARRLAAIRDALQAAVEPTRVRVWSYGIGHKLSQESCLDLACVVDRANLALSSAPEPETDLQVSSLVRYDAPF